MTKPITHYFKDYKPSAFLMDQAHLHFALEEANTEVKAILHFSRNPAVKKSEDPLVLNGEGMELVKVLVDGRELNTSEYQVDEFSLSLFAMPDKFILETVVKI